MGAGALEGKCFPERGQAGCSERRFVCVCVGGGSLGALQGPRALVKGSKSSVEDSAEWRLPTMRKEDHKERGLREEVWAL